MAIRVMASSCWMLLEPNDIRDFITHVNIHFPLHFHFAMCGCGWQWVHKPFPTINRMFRGVSSINSVALGLSSSHCTLLEPDLLVLSRSSFFLVFHTSQTIISPSFHRYCFYPLLLLQRYSLHLCILSYLLRLIRLYSLCFSFLFFFLLSFFFSFLPTA